MDENRIDELIVAYEANLANSKVLTKMFPGGMGDAMIEVALELTRDTIKALKELKELRQTKRIIDSV
jgi:hypothetical protein